MSNALALQLRAWRRKATPKNRLHSCMARPNVRGQSSAVPDTNLTRCLLKKHQHHPCRAAARMEAQGCHPQGGEQEVEPLGPEGRKVVVEDRGERWDCESVLSLRSNLENHPRKIVESSVSHLLLW